MSPQSRYGHCFTVCGPVSQLSATSGNHCNFSFLQKRWPAATHPQRRPFTTQRSNRAEGQVVSFNRRHGFPDRAGLNKSTTPSACRSLCLSALLEPPQPRGRLPPNAIGPPPKLQKCFSACAEPRRRHSSHHRRPGAWTRNTRCSSRDLPRDAAGCSTGAGSVEAPTNAASPSASG